MRHRNALRCPMCSVPATRDHRAALVHADGSTCSARRCLTCGVPVTYDAGADLMVHAFPYCGSVRTFGQLADADLLALAVPAWAAEKAQIDAGFRAACALLTDDQLADLPPEFFTNRPEVRGDSRAGVHSSTHPPVVAFCPTCHTWHAAEDRADDEVRYCPACGRVAAYSEERDRYFHADGTDNRPCWTPVESSTGPTGGSS